ncbi:MAG TPA: LytTR family DNA-binding domain-containing protein [Niabella sp.]|nr:LytTR family DNA-binding domain-containing protein [Niabella sp.]
MKVYILEDELNILKYILSLVEKIPYLQVVGYSADISKAQIEISKYQPELILADIQLKDGNSFSLLSNLETNAHVIFITAYNQYAIDALNMGAFGYLLKPIDPSVFEEIIDRCYRKEQAYKFNQQQIAIAAGRYSGITPTDRIALKSLDFTQIVAVNDIIYCQSDKGYTTFFLRDGSKLMVSKILKEYESILPETIFIRCHQSYLANTAYIRKYFKDGYLEMTNGNKIPVSDRKRQVVSDYIESIS